MKRLNDNPNHPLRFEEDGKVIGQFYNSWDKPITLQSTSHIGDRRPNTFAVDAGTFQAADASMRACCAPPVGVDLRSNVC